MSKNTNECPRTPTKKYRVTCCKMNGDDIEIELRQRTMHTSDVLDALHEKIGYCHRHDILVLDSTTGENLLSSPKYTHVPSNLEIVIEKAETGLDQRKMHKCHQMSCLIEKQDLLRKAKREENKRSRQNRRRYAYIPSDVFHTQN